MKKPASSRRWVWFLAALIVLALVATSVLLFLPGGREAVAGATRYLRARQLKALAVEATGTSVQIFAVAPHPPTEPYDFKFQDTALVASDRFWVPLEIENRSRRTLYLRLRAAAGGPQLLLSDAEYRLRGGGKESILLPLSREGAGNDKRVVINARLDIGEEHYRAQLILFDITPVMDVYSGREPGQLTLME